MKNKSTKKDHLYFIQSDVTGMIKIGRSKDPKRRLKQLQTGNPNVLKLIAQFDNYGWREKIIHESLNKWSEEGEWFNIDCVGSIPEDLYEKIEYGSFDDWWKKSSNS
tara:strand:+ start:551 stop:871 length:321 start_codon:yes stop_codon:yes gene_type:complete